MVAVALLTALVACFVSFRLGMLAQAMYHPDDVTRVCSALCRRGVTRAEIEAALLEVAKEGRPKR